MVSPYLTKPLRTLEEALRDLLKKRRHAPRSAATGQNGATAQASPGAAMNDNATPVDATSAPRFAVT